MVTSDSKYGELASGPARGRILLEGAAGSP